MFSYLLLFIFLRPQEAPAGLPLSDPHQPVAGAAGPQPGVPGQLLALLLGTAGPVRGRGDGAALLPPGVVHLDGIRSRSHVLCAGQSLQRLRALLHPEVLCSGMG